MGSVICRNSTRTNSQDKSEQILKHTNKNNDDNFSDEYVEEILCQETDIKENEMKVFDLKDDAGKVLLVKQNGILSALGNKCTHYGAPLVHAALGVGRVRCQWHGACFNILTGDIEDFPGLDSLPCYQVEIVENRNVKVRAKRSDLINNKRIKVMSKRECANTCTMIVIGGGPSGACCVETLRQEGFTGRVILINKESCLPYDRVKVSKTLDFDIKKAEYRTEQFYKEHDIEVFINTEVTSVNTENKYVTLSNGHILNYDCLYIATGSKARKLEILGSNLPEVCVLREYEHAQFVHNQLSEQKEIVILGLSFIGMEAAAYCVNKVKKVTVIGRDIVPFRVLFGESIGRQLLKLFKDKGVHFELQNSIKRCIGDEANGQKLIAVELQDGKILKADLCIMGVGSTLFTEFLDDSGINLNKDGSITVNNFMETNARNVFAGGDIANAPIFVSRHDEGNDNNAELATIGHYPLAHYHGRIAALNMLKNGAASLKAVPFFWTQLFGKSIRYAGYAREYDDIKIVGDLDEYKFIAYYFKGNTVVAMSSCQRDPIVSKFAELLAQGKRLCRKDVEMVDPELWAA